jgi:hypothetical protein
MYDAMDQGDPDIMEFGLRLLYCARLGEEKDYRRLPVYIKYDKLPRDSFNKGISVGPKPQYNEECQRYFEARKKSEEQIYSMSREGSSDLNS